MLRLLNLKFSNSLPELSLFLRNIPLSDKLGKRFGWTLSTFWDNFEYSIFLLDSRKSSGGHNVSVWTESTSTKYYWMTISASNMEWFYVSKVGIALFARSRSKLDIVSVVPAFFLVILLSKVQFHSVNCNNNIMHNLCSIGPENATLCRTFPRLVLDRLHDYLVKKLQKGWIMYIPFEGLNCDIGKIA